MSSSNILVLAVGSALYPILLGIVVLMLQAERPAPLMGGYLLGGAAMSIGIGLAILYVLAYTDAFADNGTSGRSSAANIVFGAAALLLALGLSRGWDRTWRQRRAERKERREAKRPKKPNKPEKPWSQRLVDRGSFRSAALVGMALSLPSLYYLSALKEIEENYGTSATAVLIILGFNVIQFTLVEVPLVLFLVTPERTKVWVGEFNRWLSANGRRLAEYAALVIGVYLVIQGIVALAA